MFKKLKRILSLSIVTAMIMSLVGVLPVMAEKAERDPGEYDAQFSNVTKSSNNLYMSEVGDAGKIKVVVGEDGKVSAKLTYKATSTTKRLQAICVIDGDDKDAEACENDKIEADDLGDLNYCITLPDVKMGSSFKVRYKYNGAWVVKASSLHEVKIEWKVAEEPTSVKTLKASIIRADGFSVNGEAMTKGYFVTAYDEATKTVKVKLQGNYFKMYLGKLADAKVASESACIPLSNEDAFTEITLKDIELEKAYSVCLFRSMKGGTWGEYSFTFSKGECDHTYADGICSKCGAVDKTNKDHFVVGEKEVAIKSDKNTSVVITKDSFADTADKAVALETKAGTVTFDAKAFAAIVGASETDITFEMNNIKDTPLFAKSKYDVVLDLSIKDANGTPLFATAGNGKATVTVPYDVEVAEGKKVAVFYITDEGREEVEAKYDAETKTISFEVEHFSTYAVQQVDDTTTANVTNTGDSSQMIFVMIALFASLLVSGAAFNKKRNYI